MLERTATTRKDELMTAAGWHPDPYTRFQLRYWDGNRWTEHVSSDGVNRIDPTPVETGFVHNVAGALDAEIGTVTPEKVQHQVYGQAGLAQPAAGGGGTIFTEPILVVNQKAKIIEVTNEYAIFDQHGRQIGAVRQVGQNAAKKALRVLTSLDQYMTHKFVVHDMAGVTQLQVTRPAKVFKSTVVIENPNGGEIGRIVQDNVFGKIHFTLQAGGHTYGSINAENWRAWNFNICDHTGTEVARITKTWEGLAKTLFTTADNYVVQIHRQLEEPLRSLVVAAALTVDTALKQDQRGLS